MSSSLLAGVSGLRAHQQMLDVVGNNLANVNTTGFKAQRADFADLLYQTLAQATSATSDNLGGTNPIQVGLGVQTAGIEADLKQGSLEATGGDFDMALQGNGFFVVNNGIQDLYSRAGSFGLDEKNFLVDPATGYRVQRFGAVGEGDAANPAFQASGNTGIQIPFGTSIPGRASTAVSFQGNLSASAIGPLAETLTSSTPFLAGGSAAQGSTLLNDLDSNNVDYTTGDKIHIAGTDVNGVAVSTDLSVDGTTTVTQLLAAINGAFAGATASLTTQGDLVLQADNTGPSKLTMELTDATTNVAGSTNFGAHGMISTVTGKDGDKVNTAIQIFDAQGTAHSLTLTFQKQGTNTWDLTGSLPAADGSMSDNSVAGITFNDDGSLRQISGSGVGDAKMSFQITGLSQPQTINFSFGTVNQFNGLTQYGGSTSAAATGQDGFGAGSLTGVSIGKDGKIEGVFTNGRTLPIAQLAIASFTNPGGLNREGASYYSLSNNSGIPLLGAGVTGGRGSVQQGSLESSNVDVALEFTRLITAQRGFQVNARTITVSDQVLQELATIIQ